MCGALTPPPNGNAAFGWGNASERAIERVATPHRSSVDLAARTGPDRFQPPRTPLHPGADGRHGGRPEGTVGNRRRLSRERAVMDRITVGRVSVSTKIGRKETHRVACLAMVFKLTESASRSLNCSSFLPDVIQGILFIDGIKHTEAAA